MFYRKCLGPVHSICIDNPLFQMFEIFYRKCLGPGHSIFIDNFLFRYSEFSFENVWAPDILFSLIILYFRCSEFSIENVWAPYILSFWFPLSDFLSIDELILKKWSYQNGFLFISTMSYFKKMEISKQLNRIEKVSQDLI